uniref:Uncharacterized protein n=1 Tax=Amphimedon queenslandica TaxID=400682 RepID=A0A1X7TW00_AMPQE
FLFYDTIVIPAIQNCGIHNLLGRCKSSHIQMFNYILFFYSFMSQDREPLLNCVIVRNFQEDEEVMSHVNVNHCGAFQLYL